MSQRQFGFGDNFRDKFETTFLTPDLGSRSSVLDRIATSGVPKLVPTDCLGGDKKPYGLTCPLWGPLISLRSFVLLISFLQSLGQENLIDTWSETRKRQV